MSDQNAAQIDYWNGRAGEKWATMQRGLDRMLSAATVALRAQVGVAPGDRVLDVGCGTGETCMLWLADGADVTGVDISGPMLAVAANRTGGRATLIQADASTWTGDAPFDLVVSRLGVMFFADPEAAFANLARNVRPGGRMVFVCWQSIADNAWVSTPLEAIRDLIPETPPPEPHAPGPFALADRARLAAILERAAWTDVTIAPLNFLVCLAEAGGAPTAARLVAQLGPSGAALATATDDVRAVATQRLTDALAKHDREGVVELAGALWMVEAVRSS